MEKFLKKKEILAAVHNIRSSIEFVEDNNYKTRVSVSLVKTKPNLWAE